MNANGSLFAKGVLTLGIIGMFVATRWWDWWMLVMFVIFFATFGIMSRHQSFQN
jgi:apolipoprotein N-acyltransferase